MSRMAAVDVGGLLTDDAVQSPHNRQAARGGDHRVRADRRRGGRGACGPRCRSRRCGERRHGWHQLRRLSHPRRTTRAEQRLELASPILHCAADGEHPRRRRRRRFDRPGRRGWCPPRRTGVRRERPRPGVLRARRYGTDGDRRRRAPRSARPGEVLGRTTRPRGRPRRGGARTARPGARCRRGRGRRRGAANRRRAHGRRDPSRVGPRRR